MSSKDNNVEKKYKLLPPDGGWGYMIVIAVTINLSALNMFQSSFGLLYKDFMEDIGMGSTHVTMMMGISAMCGAISGFVTSPLLSVMSLRMLTFLATLIFNLGVIGCWLINSIPLFYLCYGILQSIGIGIIYNLSFTVLNEYFIQKRLMAISITQTIIGLLTMVAPMFLKWSLEEYGYRGTLLLVAGITMNNFFGVALLQPVEWHMKKVEILDNEMNILSHGEKELNEDPKTPVLKLSELEGNKTKSNEKMYEFATENESTKGLKKIFDSMIDKSLRKTFLLSCVSLGPALCIFADMTYTFMLPQALYAAKWDEYNVALALSLMGFGDLATRVIFIFCNNWMLKLGSEEIYVLGAIIALVSRLGTLWSKSLVANMVYFTLTGVAHCSIAILIPVVIADAVPPHHFTAAMGISMMLCGVINLVLGPAIGAVRDMTDSYGAAFYLLASCFAMTVLFWMIELCYKKNKHKRLQRKEYLKQKKLNKV